MRLHHWVILGALVFVVLACFNSLQLTRKHLLTSGPRDVRAFTVRILLIVPVYSIESWLALVLRASEFNKVLTLLRKGYECLVVLSFVEILLSWLGGPEVLIASLEPECCRHLPPLSYVLPNWAPASRFVRRTLSGVLQNVLCSVVAVTVILFSWCLSRSTWSPRAFDVAQPFCLIAMNLSQFFAVYCVVTFYHANRWQLAPLRPVQKLLSIKGLVFCLFWQEAAIRVAERAGVFERLLGAWAESQDNWTVPQVAWGFLNCIICVEMFFLSILHCQVYPPGETVRLRKLLDSLESPAPSLLDESGWVLEPDDMRPVAAGSFQYACPRTVGDEPALRGGEPGWQACRRFLACLDLSDIIRFYRSLSFLWADIVVNDEKRPWSPSSRTSPKAAGLELQERSLSPTGALLRGRAASVPAKQRSQMFCV